ncbi:MAG TPA: TonB-dependent receptor [Thermoanaerobaculia bacterium]|nr:TonB-dependent receptor [Thermoanaerobaculia bacterium]
MKRFHRPFVLAAIVAVSLFPEASTAADAAAVLETAAPDDQEAAAPATAEDSAEPATTVADEIVVSASHVALERRRVGSAVTVIDRAEIERGRAVTVGELLRTVPGVAVSQTGGPGGGVSVFVRGGSSSHTLVLIDGVRANATGSGAFDWADLTTDGVERIEVLRGPQSAVHGSEAIGGVISIISRRGGEGAESSLAAELGSRDWRRLGGRFAAGSGAWDWSLAASGVETEGISHAPSAAGNRERDGWGNSTAAATVGRSLDAGRAQLALRWFDSEAGLDAFVFPQGLVDDPNYTQQRRGVVASLAIEKDLSPRWTQRLRLGVADEKTLTRDPDPEPFFHDSSFFGTTVDAELAADLVLAAGNALSVGYVFERRRGEQLDAFDAEAELHSLYVEDRFERGDLALAVGARHDDHSEFGGETTFRGTAAWRLAGRGRLHASWGSGFKAPTFVDLYFPFYGNPRLAPERSESWDFGVERSWWDSRLVVDLTAFSARYRDLITFDTRTFLAANVAHADVDGLEAAVTYRAGAGWGLAGAYTLTDSEDRATGELLPRRPRHTGSLALDLSPAPGWTVHATVVALRERIDSDGGRLADTERVGATVDRALGPRLAAYLRLENLFDEEGEEVGGYASPGTSATVGLRYGLR